MGFLGTTFGPDSWRRVAYGAVAAPVGLAGLGLVLAGRPGPAAAVQRRVTGRLLGVPGRPRDRWPGTVAYALVSLPLGILGLWLALMLVPNTARNLLYGVFVDDYATAWGGPTRAGAWAVHAVLALQLVPVGLWLARGLTALQRRLADALLGTGRLTVGTGVAGSVVLLAGAVFLAAWVRQV
jgi:hypothetical protein